MKPSDYKKAMRTRGQVILLAVIFFSIITAFSAVMSQNMSTYVGSERRSVASAQALALAEAGIDTAAYQLNQSASYSGEVNSTLPTGTFTTTVTTIDASNKRVTSTGVSTFHGQTVTKSVTAKLSIDSTIVAFRYGVQVGSGGFVMSGGSTINGNVYSNGDIDATTGVRITGSATAANPSATSTDQANNTPSIIGTCSSSTCITFGNSGSTQDLAQSFTVSKAEALNSIRFYIKKVGSPSNATVRIVADASGSPEGDTIMSGTLSASAVSTSFGWVSVTMPANPILDPSLTYWIVIDAASNASRYYIMGANNGGYPGGATKIGTYDGSWANLTPATLDSYFEVYLGGGTSMIGGNTYSTGVYVGTTASDNAWAHTVQGATVTGIIYCTVGSYLNKVCDTSRADPDPQPMPLSDSNIADWKEEAEAGGVISGNYTVGYAGAVLGPKKITGDLLVNGGGTLTVSGTLWVEGSITVTGGGRVNLASSYGSNDGAIVTDGVVVISGGGTFAGSGTTGSYPFLITTSACPAAADCDGANAISLTGGAGTVALIAQNGTANIAGGSALKAITAQQIVMTGGATLNYDSGLINSNFSSGPGGSWQLVAGSYSITK